MSHVRSLNRNTEEAEVAAATAAAAAAAEQQQRALQLWACGTGNWYIERNIEYKASTAKPDAIEALKNDMCLLWKGLVSHEVRCINEVTYN